MRFNQSIWQAGFRPFFLVALFYGMAAPLLWYLIFSQKLTLAGGGLNPVQWHAHEMLFGFGFAVLGGFLLTASKNWVGVRGIYGGTLVVAVCFWVIERLAIFFAGHLEGWVFWGLSNLTVSYVVAYVCWTLWHFRKQDSFSDNFIFLLVLPIFIVAKNLLLSREWYLPGIMMSIGLFRVAFVVMFERTIPQFMKNAMSENLLRNVYLNSAIKLFAVLSVFTPFMSQALAVVVLGSTAILLGFRFVYWKPARGFTNFGIGLSYFGYLGLILHFVVEALVQAGALHLVGTVSIHTFFFLCMGVVIPAMIIRISQGHTGRKLVFARSDRFAILCMLVGALCRLLGTQIWPQHYTDWILAAAIGWSLCFVIIGIRLSHFLLSPRVDGREH